MIRRLLIAALVTSVALAAGSASASATQYFSSESYWYKPLADNAPLDARSDIWAQKMSQKVATYGKWINTTSYSTPVYTVPADQPTVRVKIDWAAATYDEEFAAVPVPAGLVPAAGGDMHAAIWQPSTDTLWEFWQMRVGLDGMWHANTAGKITNASQSDGTFAPHNGELYGGDASGTPLAPGLITPDELKAGVINHAVTLAIPKPLYRWYWTWPAISSDGDSQDPYDIPEGARFRLPANLDLLKLGMTRTGYIIAKAVQKYGLIVDDRSSSVHFNAQDPVNLGSDPYPALFENKTPSAALYNFPWVKLQALMTQPNYPFPTSY